ncbi:MAG: alpha/beta hydrolase [Chloroflexaceae bacterium]|jgi:pimeloyl-ACP methyl ester carboxylesterase|nr:alpha/beta hydrolase [Chloroflexaceae bacterium]
MPDSDLHQQLDQFRATHPVTRRVLAGVAWDYMVCGQGRETLLLLPGAPGVAEMAFRYVLAFEKRYRVVAPSYPACIGSAAQLLEGLGELVATETSGPLHLAGASYSGLVAQYLVRRHPSRFATVMLGDTGVPRPERANWLRLLLAAVGRLPILGLHGLLWCILARLLWGATPMHRFWRGYFRAVVSDLTMPAFLNRMAVWVEMDECENQLGPPLPWPGPVLLLQTVDDPLFSASEQATLRARFPQAELHTFSNDSHTTALTRADEYINLMLEFVGRRGVA